MWEEIKQYFFNRYQIFWRNKKLLIWLIVSFLMMWLSSENLFLGFILTFVFYAIVISIAVSNTFEKILIKLEDGRHIATSTEKRRLNNLFDEVYDTIREKNPKTISNIKLYIVDSIKVNAMSIGKSSILINRGLMETMSDEQIKGVLAHEFAHIVNGDTQVQLLITVATTIYLWLILFFVGLTKFISNMMSDSSVGNILDFIIKILNLAVSLFLIIWTLILGCGSRREEYKADKFAFDIGYGEEITSALYELYDMQINDKKKLINRMQEGHPRLAYRIEKLERLLEID